MKNIGNEDSHRLTPTSLAAKGSFWEEVMALAVVSPMPTASIVTNLWSGKQAPLSAQRNYKNALGTTLGGHG